MTKNEILKIKLDEYARDTGYSGITRIVKGGEDVFTHICGYADAALNEPVTAEHRFRFYSMTKPFVAISLMMLAEKGLINIDEHPGKYLPCAEGLDSRITVRDVLQHVSGLSEVTTLERLDTPHPVDQRAEIAELADMPLMFDPESNYCYCNTNFILASLIVEELSGMKIGEYIEKNVFPAFGMETAFCANLHPLPEKWAIGFDKTEDGALVPCGYVNMAEMGGCGDLCGTIDDLTAFVRALRERKLLRTETWDEIFKVADVVGYGLGCSIFDWHGHTSCQHSGGHRGYRILQRYMFDEDLSVIVLSNAGFGNARDEICEIIYDVYFKAGDEEATPDMPEMDKGFI